MLRHLSLAFAIAASLSLVPIQAAGPPLGGKVKKAKPKVEVVFCLDTTGSMGGLIEGAKSKIWSICNQIASGKPTPDLKVGLVAFRDKGDAYITKVYELSDDLDAIHGHLKTFKAEGGGDTPESVNQALDDAVNKINWSKDKKTLRIIFLVGDAPPHMDYKDDVKYPATCKKACEKGIIINTIQCGTDPECTKFWKDICVKAEGSFVAIPQNGGVVITSTPFDDKLAKLNTELGKTALVFGTKARQLAGKDKNEESLKLDSPAAAERVAYQAKNAQVAAFDLLDNIKQKKVKLEDLKKEELPEPLKKLNLKEQKAYLKKLDARRAELNKQVLELDKQRCAFIAKEQAEAAKKGKGGFDGKVLDVLRTQAKKKGIKY
jgi:Mg-chelatase subunit ChlD